MTEREALEMLGLALGASPDEIRAAFRERVEGIPPGDEADARFARLLAARNAALLYIDDRERSADRPASDWDSEFEDTALADGGGFNLQVTALTLIERHTAGIGRYRLIALAIGGVSLIVSLTLADVLPIPYWVIPRHGLNLAVFAVLTLLCALYLPILSRMRKDIVREVMQAEEILDNPLRLGELFQILISVGGLGALWTRNRLESAVRSWLRPGKASCGVSLGNDDAAETALKDLAHRIGPVDFASYLVTKGVYSRSLLEYIEPNAAGRLSVRYGLNRLPQYGGDWEREGPFE